MLAGPIQNPPQMMQRNPKELLWLHQTISPCFSQGAPDPDPKAAPGAKLPGEHVKKVADDLKKNPDLAQDFPPLKVFTLTDPDTGLDYTYSLSNRRLTAFRMGNVPLVKTQQATDEEIFTALWKMTSVDGGNTQPQMTLVNKQHDTKPAETTTLGKFKVEMTEKARSRLFAYEQFCAANDIVGAEKVAFIAERQGNVARAMFGLR